MAYPEPEVGATGLLQRIISDATDVVVATVLRSSSADFPESLCVARPADCLN